MTIVLGLILVFVAYRLGRASGLVQAASWAEEHPAVVHADPAQPLAS